MIDLALDSLRKIKDILKKHVPDCEVKVFGSRVSGQAKRHSDLDLVMMSSEPISERTMAALRQDFEVSDIPVKVDLIDWSVISDSFRATIKAGPTETIHAGLAGPK